MKPPDLPAGSVYTQYYCEENVYLLSQTFLETPVVSDFWEIVVIFISNNNKTVALWYQKAAADDNRPVVWDYHVILALKWKAVGIGSLTR
uniref:Protein N-terminal glutamine amidohydrolase n=1 Tax=Psilocybe cubensis TaxID=181762 RepID=A0A8H7Y5B1_PSICU